jgi:hypothetical protein
VVKTFYQPHLIQKHLTGPEVPNWSSWVSASSNMWPRASQSLECIWSHCQIGELSPQTNLSDINLPELMEALSQTVYLRSVARRVHRRMICRGGEYRHRFNWKALLCVRILKNFANSISR